MTDAPSSDASDATDRADSADRAEDVSAPTDALVLQAQAHLDRYPFPPAWDGLRRFRTYAPARLGFPEPGGRILTWLADVSAHRLSAGDVLLDPRPDRVSAARAPRHQVLVERNGRPLSWVTVDVAQGRVVRVPHLNRGACLLVPRASASGVQQSGVRRSR